MTEAIALLIFLLPLAYSPGPGNSFFAVNGALHGLRAIWPALLGYHVATFIVTFAIGYGLSVGFLANPTVGLALKVLSAGYMVWIAWVCLASAYRFSAATENPGRGAGHPSFTVGAILMLSNPKAYAIIAAMFAGFIGGDASTAHLIFITTIFTLNNMVAFYGWAAAGKALTRYLDGRVAYLVYGLSFLAVAIWMLLR